MSYQVVNARELGTSMFYIGDETGALYVRMPNRNMLCVDAGGSGQKVGIEYAHNAGYYTQVKIGATITVKVGK